MGIFVLTFHGIAYNTSMSNDTEYDLRQQRQAEAQAERQMQIDDAAKELAEQISRFVNAGGAECAKALGRAMANDHRTLVQTKIHTILAFTDRLTEDMADGRFDARNEAACKIATKMTEAVVEERQWIPYV